MRLHLSRYCLFFDFSNAMKTSPFFAALALSIGTLTTLSTVQAAPASAIVGKWEMVTVSASSYTNTTTGYMSPGFGGVQTYNFFPGGRYTMTSVIKMGSYSGDTNSYTSKTGTYRVSGDKVTIKETSGFYDMQFMGGGRRKRSARGSDLKHETYTWKLSSANGKPALLMNSGKGFVTYKKQ